MQYQHSSDQANEYASAALERMHKSGLAPTPQNYELWYVYYSRQNEDVVRAIDILIANNQKITEERCQELHQRFLSPSHNEDKVRRAGDQLHITIKDVAGVVKGVRTATSDYSGKLVGVSDKITPGMNSDQVSGLLQAMMTDTEKMLQQNMQLEQQLDKSTTAMEELQRDLESIRREAMTDGLTGLANRKAFDSEIRRIACEAESTKTVFTLLMMDIDHFKSFNDNFGHQVGDQVLRLVAKTMTDGVKGKDIAARYGGEEFAVILPDTELAAGVSVGNSLRRTVATKDVVNRNSGEKLGRITMSVGVAEFYAGEPVEDLIERADAALYTAKHNGRNQVAAAPTPGKKKKKDLS